MSFVTKNKIQQVIEEPKKKSLITILKDVELIKLASECRICQRLKFIKGSCGGRQGENICLGFKESPVAKLMEKAFNRC